jgi:hypothetical protein
VDLSYGYCEESSAYHGTYERMMVGRRMISSPKVGLKISLVGEKIMRAEPSAAIVFRVWQDSSRPPMSLSRVCREIVE